jgi:exodeoxyribonuclease V alpha subunit
MPALDPRTRAIIEADALVTVIGSTQQRPDTPFVIDADHFLLRRNFLHEVAIAAEIAARRAEAQPRVVYPRWLDELFAGDADARALAQREAVASVAGRRFFVLTGAPGTGKTTTVLRMLTLLARVWLERGGSGEPVIRVSAPTGKAAQRLAQSLRDGAQPLREGPSPLSGAWQAALECARNAPASTLHRLLGTLGHEGRFRHHRGNPLAADIVIVDEASMIDLALLRCLLDALRADALLVLVGDADQLASVGTGSVLRDVVAALAGAPELVRLEHSFRADQALVPINRAVREGDVGGFRAACAAAGARVALKAPSSPKQLLREIERWGRDLHRHLHAIGALAAIDDGTAAIAVLDALRQRQLLCALRETERGAEAVNEALEQAIRNELDEVLDGRWYRGRIVMITTNDYSSGLYNGDVGVCLADSEGAFKVWFESGGAGVEAAGSPARRAVALAIGSLPAHQGAFAVTIHKSQGSEYDHVAVLLPDDVDSPILSREMLYTGVSRARQSLEIWGRAEIVERALTRRVQRAGLLEQRLRSRG